jgi:polyhydroxyalkanoate synthesis repressor PhaR
MSDQRLINKYPNRRLYDTTESRYITLGDIEKLVRSRISFAVVEKKSQKDITGSILLQVLAGQEHLGEPMMSRDFLCDAIRAHGSPLQRMLGCYLEQSARVFVSQNRESRGGVTPTREALTSLASTVYSRWLAVNEDHRTSGHG